VHPETWIGQSDGTDEYSSLVADLFNFVHISTSLVARGAIDQSDINRLPK
jgi:hypothetical protein